MRRSAAANAISCIGWGSFAFEQLPSAPDARLKGVLALDAKCGINFQRPLAHAI
jgi:hypothetical protein